MTDHKAVMKQALDSLIGSARLLGTTQAAKLCGIYSQKDAMLEGACYRIIAAKTQTILEAIAQPEQPATNKLLQIIAAAYQVAGACDLPGHILDVLANPGQATQEQIDAMLPFVQPEQTTAADFYQFQTKDGAWHFFSDEEHYENTVVDGRWPVRSLYVTPQAAQPEQPATEQNFCPRCGKRHGRADDVHTCTPHAHTKENK